MISVFDYVVLHCGPWDMDQRNITEGSVETTSPEQQLHNSPLMLFVGPAYQNVENRRGNPLNFLMV
jgi:hypothetical protein